jgi:hypothetical protein
MGKKRSNDNKWENINIYIYKQINEDQNWKKKKNNALSIWIEE